jgi:tRNA/rRNA methyltransferase
VAGTDRSHGSSGIDPDGPAIVLVGPQLGENIGTAARAMLNCGLGDLRLVNPRDGWPSDKARSAASGADSVIDGARLYADIPAAIADLHHVYAATARRREVVKPVLTPRAAAAEIRAATRRNERCGILFGPERWGLLTDEVSFAASIVEVPLNPAFASLNLAQAVLVIAYEWRITGDAGPGKVIPTLAAHGGPTELADQADTLRFFEHLEKELDESGYLFPPDKRPTMVRNLRSIFLRAELTEPEVRSLRGVVKALVQRRRDLEARGVRPPRRRGNRRPDKESL